jgi:hypothetical protein
MNTNKINLNDESNEEPNDTNNTVVNYDATDNLIYNIDKELLSSVFNNVKICAYKILNKEKNPFIQFLLFNDVNTNSLSLPSIDILTITQNIALSNTKDLLSYIQCFFGFLFNNLDMIENNKFMGFHLDKKTQTFYIFYDFTDCKFNISLIYKNSKIWFALVDEIINKQHICGININTAVTHFFLLNQQFVTLTNNLGIKLEHPVTCYVGKETKQLNFTHYFGVSKMDNEQANLGSFYYFTDFDNAFYSYNKNEKGGIVRFAVFLGKMLVKFNYPEDLIDYSETKREKNKDSKLEQMTMRITDYDGTWSSNYDSCFVGKIKLDNGDILTNTPIFAVKKYEQQYSLSYHFTNANNGTNNGINANSIK